MADGALQVVVVAEKEPAVLRALNAQMRRIDLLCKLFGPLFIALMDGLSTQTAITVNLVMNCTSVWLEYFAIARVYRDVPELQEPAKNAPAGQPAAEASPRVDADHSPETRGARRSTYALHLVKQSVADFALHFAHRAFLPSIAGALLYLTVLSFAGQMVTYLLSTNYSTTQVGIARTFGVCLEVVATWVAPWLISKIGPVRAGLWFSSWQVTMLVAGVAVFWVFADNAGISASGLVGGVILSRVGLRGFDLCVQLIVQQVCCPLQLVVKHHGYILNRLARMLELKVEGYFPRSRRLGRTLSSFFPTSRPSSSPPRRSLGGRR